jgi:DNA-directed RNA polymerase
MNLIEKEEFIKITKNNILNFYKEDFNKKYKRKYSINYYLNLIFEFINDVNN